MKHPFTCSSAIAVTCSVVATLAAPSLLTAKPEAVEVNGSQIVGPAQQENGDQEWFSKMTNWRRDTAAAHGDWLAALKAWRTDQLKTISYRDDEYKRPELLWTQQDFVQPQAMVEDRFLYDTERRCYTADRYLDDLEGRYGGIDSVLLWPVYPNIGIDHRNQWDLPRDLPGGIPALRKLVEDFHRRGVRVFFPTMPWDTGSRSEGMTHAEATAKLLAETGADGINGDTCAGLTKDYRTASDATGHPVALEPELSMSDDAMLAYNQQSWAYWNFPFVPRVSKWKWLEPRHMIHVCDRWATDRKDVLQAAFFNGVGVESWENVWGFWNGITPRDGEALRRIRAIYRAFPDLIVSKDWTPHFQTEHYGVYASEFPSSGQTLWTVINRNDFEVNENLLRVPHQNGDRYIDLWNGVEVTPAIEKGSAVLSARLEPDGYGAFLRVEAGAAPRDLDHVIEALHSLAAKPLRAFSNEWNFLPQQLVEIPPTAPSSATPAGMIRIPGGSFHFKVRGIEIEGENRSGLDVQYPWETSPRREHSHRLQLKPYFIDEYPVTNADFKAFLDATHYWPADDHHFLRHWSNGAPVAGDAKRPVTWVSLEDARAYAAWAGKRLPHEWEWQFAAQGDDGRLYPWGTTWDVAAVPKPHLGRDLPAPSEVDARPQGASPFGVKDLVGNIWQWTDEVVDTHTRAAVLRGGSFYQPQNSYWYFPQGYRLDEHGKYLLMAPSKDRAGTVGFRCVKDAL